MQHTTNNISKYQHTILKLIFVFSVMAHAHGADGIRMAAESGVRSVEHASFIDQRGIEACLKNNVWMVPTFSVGTLENKHIQEFYT
jgi:imidazolonepropionase-like amidohydrolase